MEERRFEDSPETVIGDETTRPGGDSPRAEARSIGVVLHLATALLVLVAVCALAATGAELIAAGRAALDRGDVDQATAQLEKAVAVDPNDSDAHYYLGLAYGRQAQKAGGVDDQRRKKQAGVEEMK